MGLRAARAGPTHAGRAHLGCRHVGRGRGGRGRRHSCSRCRCRRCCRCSPRRCEGHGGAAWGRCAGGCGRGRGGRHGARELLHLSGQQPLCVEQDGPAPLVLVQQGGVLEVLHQRRLALVGGDQGGEQRVRCWFGRARPVAVQQGRQQQVAARHRTFKGWLGAASSATRARSLHTTTAGSGRQSRLSSLSSARRGPGPAPGCGRRRCGRSSRC